MNTFGMNLLLWGTEMDESMFPILEQIKEAGYGGVEVPVFDVNPSAWNAWRKQLDALELDRVAVTFNGAEHHQISSDPLVRKKTLERNKRALECAKVMGAKFLTGPIHSALCVFSGSSPNSHELDWAQENLYELAEYAKQLDLVIGLEYLNRFESYLVTSSEELIKLCASINHPNCQLMFDTFHANIEEKNMSGAVESMGNRLVHVQVSENDRGTLGKGHVDFKSVFQTLKKMNYEGMISVEAFSTKLAAANIWRKTFSSEMELVKESIQFLKNIAHES
ncbi:MAG: hypothetical protein RL131_417 [Bacteroidota bacterium]